MSDLLKKAIQLHKQGNLAEANEIYAKLLDEKPDNATVCVLIAQLGVETQEYSEAINLLLAAIQHQPTNPEIFFTMGYCLEKIGWAEQAINSLQKCIELQPSHMWALSNLGHLLLKIGNADAAGVAFDKALELNPKLAEAIVGKILVLKAKGMQKQSLDLLAKTRTENPNFVDSTLANEVVLKQLEERPDPYYKPIPNETSNVNVEAAGAPNSAVRPKIRVLHQMAMGGASDIAKCMACMNQTLFFNNIHPMGAAVEQFGVNIFTQANQWYNLFTKEDMDSLEGKVVEFPQAIKLIHHVATQKGQNVLLRDWTHIDYIAKPFFDKPTFKLTTVEALKQDFEVLQMFTVRHPIDQWISLNDLAIVNGKITITEFLAAYLEYAKVAKAAGFVKYEDFARNPDAALIRLCKGLELPFDPAYGSKWPKYKNFTSEYMEYIGSILPHVRKTLPANFMEPFETDFNYWAALEILGYNHPI